jgi:hypothetical protein
MQARIAKPNGEKQPNSTFRASLSTARILPACLRLCQTKHAPSGASFAWGLNHIWLEQDALLYRSQHAAPCQPPAFSAEATSMGTSRILRSLGLFILQQKDFDLQQNLRVKTT